MPRPNGITRQEILTSIKRNSSMTAEELARELNISQVAVRQHLASLEAEGIITVSIERRGLGRPSHRYTLTPQGDELFPRHYDELANSLLNELRISSGEEAVRNLFNRRRERQRMMIAPRIQDRPMDEQIKELAEIQTDKGYMAEVEVEEGPGCYRLVQHNCAIYKIAKNHPEICCNSDLALIRSLLPDSEVERDQYRFAGNKVCSFKIQPKK